MRSLPRESVAGRVHCPIGRPKEAAEVSEVIFGSADLVRGQYTGRTLMYIIRCYTYILYIHTFIHSYIHACMHACVRT